MKQFHWENSRPNLQQINLRKTYLTDMNQWLSLNYRLQALYRHIQNVAGFNMSASAQPSPTQFSCGTVLHKNKLSKSVGKSLTRQMDTHRNTPYKNMEWKQTCTFTFLQQKDTMYRLNLYISMLHLLKNSLQNPPIDSKHYVWNFILSSFVWLIPLAKVHSSQLEIYLTGFTYSYMNHSKQRPKQ